MKIVLSSLLFLFLYSQLGAQVVNGLTIFNWTQS